MDNQVDCLINILKEMASHKFDNNILSNNLEDQFFSYETKFLYQSFQAIYQILLYTSENIFEINDTETLIKLSNHLKFFKEFYNIHAEGITNNNIATLLMAKGHLFESLEYFVQSIVCARYEIQQFCKENPYSFSAFLISEFGYSDNIQEIITEQNNRFSIKFVNEKKKSNVTKQSSQKTVNSSVNKLKKQTTNFSQSAQVDPSFLEKLKLYNQFLKQNNIMEQQIIFDDSNDELKEQRIYLLQNLYSRNRNLIISLLLINAFHKNSFNFWNEIIEILDLLTRITEYLPQKELQQYEILTVRYKALLELKKVNKLDYVEKQIENIIQNNKQSKEQLLLSKIFKNSKQQQYEFVNQMKQFNEISNSFIIQNSPIYKYKDQSPIKRSQITSSEKKKTQIIQKSIYLNKNEASKDISIQTNYQNNSIYQFIIKLNDTKKIFLQNKILNNGLLNLNLAENDYKNYFLNKVNDIIIYCKQNQKLDFLFDFRNNLDSAVQDYYLLNNYYSLDNLNCIFTVFKSQFLVQSGQFKKAAEILTSLFENQKQIMSHYSIKISMVLKEIFARSKIQSREFNQFFQQFDNNISMQIALIFDCEKSSELIFQSVQLFSNLINQVLNWARDQLGIILSEQNQKIIEAFMPMMNIQQIKFLQNQIIKKLMNIINNGDVNQLFEKLSSKIYDDIYLFDDQNKQQFNDKESFINQLSVSQQNQSNPQAAKNYALDSIREEKLLISQEYDLSQISLISEEPTVYKNNLRGLQQIGNVRNFINTRETYQNQRNIQKNWSKKPQQLIFTPKILTHLGDESLIQSHIEDSNQTVAMNEIYQLKNEHFFHISIHKALSSLFVNQIKYEQINQRLQKSSGLKFNFQYNFKQYRYIIYCTKQLSIKNNCLFQKLCQILSALNIQVIILLQIAGSSFIEQQPGQTYIYNKIEVFRVFYNDQQIVNFLKNQRNKVNFYSYSTQIQHY
ncbi:tetratricopeptide repeat protein (macronuclear) [Tetrahymena thermophila SB210]|uniref:Tetratricopeptide repeat protein n=1 Tax=Tetrahymena thermophila (strain SB210) TaxID=312017 RepID=Q234D5_TETTS|nr:tetratricopeptide repeat protein [Tetrahymena thermophila SB210]EAR92068.2 tetratricopeptide repeat protein [Tetrahymena thermophila SB210]|eukprot:XP_001012313.2 tetratricopeptide repeat protein [Tetrahymena thermophila SB210]